MNKGKHKNLFIGMSGEYRIVSELLMRGYNANIVTVDTGVDILAEKGDSVYKIQVKARTLSEDHSCLIALSSKKLEELYRENINLVVAFIDPTNIMTFLIISPSLLYLLTTGGYKLSEAPIKNNGEKKNLTIRLIFKEGRAFIRNRRNDFSLLLNRFDLIEDVENDPFSIPWYAEWGENSVIELNFDE
jgi:hypothetical protein